ncbi:MAG: A24 family peptidase [Firmicutes bacterium]|nr:A24 family peptidase [Bacillota bacterium]
MTMTAENVAMLAGCLIPSIYVACTDSKYYLIYDKVTFPVILAGLINALYLYNLRDALLGFAFASGLLFACAVIGGAGGGDVKYAAGLGMWFGFRGILDIMFLAAVIGIAWSALKLAKSGDSGLRERLKLYCTGVYLRVICGVGGAVPMRRIPDNPDAPVPAGAVPFGACLAAAAWAVWLFQMQKGVM